MPGPKMSVVGDSVRLVPAGSPALFELSALGFTSKEIDVQIISKCTFSMIQKSKNNFFIFIKTSKSYVNENLIDRSNLFQVRPRDTYPHT